MPTSTIPITNTFSPPARTSIRASITPNSLLLPDATVLLVGGNPARGSYEQHIEIYSPAYLFNADGTPALRPTITGVTPGAFGYGATFQVQTPDAADIASVVLVRPVRRRMRSTWSSGWSVCRSPPGAAC